MKHYFVINPAAGRGLASRLLPRIREAFRGREEALVLYTTAGPQDAVRYVEEQCRQTPGEELRFYACGGDGTANEVARGLLGFGNAALGVVPCGSGNDLVKNFPDRDFLDMGAQLRGNTVPMDLVRFCGRVSVNLCNCGLDADVAHNMPRFKGIPGVSGPMAYQLSILYTFFHRLGKKASVSLDGGPPAEAELLLLVCANGRYYGGSYQGAPLARVDDGLLDVCMVPKISRRRILGFIRRYQKGLHLVDKDLQSLVTYRQVRRAEVVFREPVTMCLDGETFQGDRMTAEILPAALRLVLPAKAGESAETI